MFTGSKVAGFGVLLLLSARMALACAEVPGEPKVTPTFRVIVTRTVTGQQPVGLIPITLRDEKWKVIAQQTTDKDGIAEFHSIRPGKYWVMAVRDDVASTEIIEIATSESAKPELSLMWPPWDRVWTKSLKGQLLWNRAEVKGPQGEYVPFAGAELRVYNEASGVLLAVAHTSNDGTFDLSALKAAMYRVHVSKRDSKFGEIEGEIPVEVSTRPSAAEDSVKLQLLFTDCGLTYRKPD